MGTRRRSRFCPSPRIPHRVANPSSVRAGLESYSIKRLEPLYGFDRDAALPDANAALALLQASIELDDTPSISDQTNETVLTYNRDDCRSARPYGGSCSAYLLFPPRTCSTSGAGSPG